MKRNPPLPSRTVEVWVPLNGVEIRKGKDDDVPYGATLSSASHTRSTRPSSRPELPLHPSRRLSFSNSRNLKSRFSHRGLARTTRMLLGSLPSQVSTLAAASLAFARAWHLYNVGVRST